MFIRNAESQEIWLAPHKQRPLQAVSILLIHLMPNLVTIRDYKRWPQIGWKRKEKKKERRNRREARAVILLSRLGKYFPTCVSISSFRSFHNRVAKRGAVAQIKPRGLDPLQVSKQNKIPRCRKDLQGRTPKKSKHEGAIIYCSTKSEHSVIFFYFKGTYMMPTPWSLK